MNTNIEVTDWFAQCDNPQKEAMELVREIILNTHPKMTENVKWSAPNFMCNGKNLCTFNPRSKKAVSLMFHTGATMQDKGDLLEGEGKQARVGKFADVDDVKAKRTALESLVNEWVALNS